MLVTPLDEPWRDAVDAVLRARGWPDLSHAARLGSLVAELSASYNVEGTAGRALLPARLAFSFARDVPKGTGAVRELVALGRLAMPEARALRVLDLGAGLGATTWGVARALEAAGQRGEIDATWIDTDAAALGVAQELHRELQRARGADAPIAVRVRAHTGPVAAPRGEPFDLVLLGQVLSELDAPLAPDARVAKHAALLRALAGALRPAGSLVVVEPALRERTRHLHAVRDALLADPDREPGRAGDAPRVNVFAPCLHAAACPMLASPADWCHEDLAVDLPEWLAPIARAAGLRWQGLTFSYLVVRTDGATLASRGFPWRVVSGAIVSKGKRELFVCGDGARLRVQRLDRHATGANAAWESLARGARLATNPPISSGERLGRVTAETAVDVDRATE